MTDINKHGDEDRVEFYTDENGDVRWRFRSSGNGEVMADSAEGYKSFVQAWDSAERVVGRILLHEGQEPHQVKGVAMEDTIRAVDLREV
jgi:uncharacterized protein YegP (UPF0339 family)